MPAPRRLSRWGRAWALFVNVTVVAVALVMGGPAGGLRAQAPDQHAASREYNRALGVECVHCHVEGALADASKPNLDFARRMARMVRGLNDGPLRATGGVSCWSCHRGQAVPRRLPAANWERIEADHAATFATAPDGLGLTMSVYAASLGVECTHCHIQGAWRDASKRPHRLVATMSTIFDLVPGYFDPSIRTPRTQCFMCHQGSVKVERTSR